MTDVQLAANDLNLLLVLRALLVTRSTVAAARSLGRTQSAVSHALGRLRLAIGDPLFVRAGARLVPTTFAMSLLSQVETVLGGAETIFRGRAPVVDPGELRRSFRIGATDLLGFSVLPRLVARLKRISPHVDLEVRGGSDMPMERRLVDRDVDVAFGTRFRSTSLSVYEVGRQDMVAILRRGHPSLARKLTLDAYCKLEHVVVSPRGEPGSAVDSALAAIGRSRRVTLRVPHFATAALVVSKTDLVTALPRGVVRTLRAVARFEEVDLPLTSPRFVFQVAVARDRADEPALAWLTGELAAVCRAALGGGSA